MEKHEHHEHDHDHDHRHHHHDAHCGCESGGIDIAEHEGALIGTCTGHIPADSLDAAKAKLCGAMTALASRITEADGVIGHIKAIVAEEGRGFQISVTDEDAAVRDLLPHAYRADCTAIVFAVEEDALCEFMTQTLLSLIVPDEDEARCCGECEDEA